MSEKTEHKKLYRSNTQKMIAGVCGGVAEYLNIDPIIVRIIWAFSVPFGGTGLWAYIIFLVLVPQNPEVASEEAVKKGQLDKSLTIGIALVVFGLIFLSNNFFDVFWIFDWPWFNFYHFDWDFVWPVLLILFGAWFVWNAQKKNDKTETNSSSTATSDNFKELKRSKTSKMIAGVCGGLAHYWNMDVTIIRVGVVFVALLTDIWLVVIAYVVFLFAVPEEKTITT